MIISRQSLEKERRDPQCLASERLSFSTVNRRFSDRAWRNLLLWGAVVGWLGAAGVGQGAIPEVLVREEALRVIDTVELFRNGLYWWTSSACSETPNPGGAAYLAFSDPRRINSTLSGHQFFQGYLGGFRPGDLFEPGLPLDTKISGLKGVLPPDCGYGAHFVRDDEAFYYAHGRALFRKPLNALIATAGEPITFEVGLNRFPVTADGVLFVTDTELWSYAADPAANTLTLQRTGKRGRTEVRDVLVLPGVSIRKFTLVDIQGTDGSHSGSELILLTPDGRLYRAGLSGNLQLVRTGVSDFALRNEAYPVRGDLGFIEKRRATTLYVALGNTATHQGEGRLLGLDLTSGGRGEFLEFGAGPDFRVTSVAVDAQRIFLTRTLGAGTGNAELLRRRAPADTTLVGLGDPDYQTIATEREFRSLRSSGRSVFFAHENTVQRLAVEAPSIDVDFEAFAIEVTQAIQNLNNTVSLVASKPVIVRGYARLGTNNTGLAGFDVPAQLHVLHAPVSGLGQPPFTEVPGSPFPPVQVPTVTVVDSLPSVRTNLNSTYQFEVPEAVVKAGDLRFEFVLNPGRVAPETGANPLANNAATATLRTRETVRPWLVMVPVRYNTTFYDPKAPDSKFWDIIARAETLLPLPDFRVAFRNVPVVKRVFTVGGAFEVRSFDLPEEKSEALAAVNMARVWDGDPLGGPYVGMIPWTAVGFGGIGYVPGRAMVVNMSGQPRTEHPWSSIVGGHILAHEFGHNTGLLHIRSDETCGNEIPDPTDGRYDWLPNGASPCTLGATNLDDPATAVGFDPLSWSLALPGANGDLMSYATPRWISEFNWKRLADVYAVPPGAVRSLDGTGLQGPPPGPWLIVQGMLDPATDSAEFLPLYTVPASVLDPALLVELTGLPDDLPPEYPVRLQLLDAAGQVIEDQPAPLRLPSEGTVAQISRALPMSPAARVVRLVNDGRTLVAVTASATAPTLEVGEPIVADGTLSVAWSAGDADGDPLLFTTQFSRDGETWQTLGVNLPENALAVSTATLPGGAAAQVRVLATDGLDTAIAVSRTFVLAKHPPEAQITGVADGQRFDFGSVVTVEGFGYDAEDGSLAAEALRWVLQGPETRDSIGGRLILANLAPGAYTLALTATDGDGLTATQTLPFAIRPLAVADGAEPVLDGLCADPGYGSTPPARFAAASGSHAQVRFTHAGSALFVCFMGLSYGAPNTPGAVAGLRVNPSGSSQPVVTTVGFAVNEHGEPLRLGGDGSEFVALTNPPPGFAAVILRDAQAWSAEMRIDDSLLGGWNSVLGLVVYVDPGNSVGPQLTWPPNASLANPSSWATAQSAPGRLIYGRQEGNRIARILSAKPDGSDETFITDGARPELSPDGRFLAFVRGGDYTTWLDNDLFVRDLESGVETQIGSNSFEQLLLYDWTADSQTLFADYANTLYRARRNGTDLTALPFVHEADDAPTVNPVDGRLAFQSPGGLVLEQQDRSGRTPVPNTPPSARWPEWAPDGQWLSYSDGTNVWKIRSDGAGQVKLTAFSGTDKLEGFTSPWTQDSRAVLVVATLNGARGLYAVAADGSGAANQVPMAPGLPLYWVSRRPPPLVTPSGATVRIVESSLTPTGFSLRCDVPAGVLLQLERTGTPSEPRWEAVGDVVVQSGPATWLRDPTAGGRAQGYYRVRVVGGP